MPLVSSDRIITSDVIPFSFRYHFLFSSHSLLSSASFHRTLYKQLVKSFSSNVSLEESDVLEDLKNTTGKKAQFYSIQDMSRDFSFMDWKKSVAHFQQFSKVPVTHVYVQNSEYMRKLSVLLSRYSAETVDNFLSWSFIARFLPYASTGLRKIYEEFRKEVPEPVDGEDGVEASRVFLSHWQECVHLTCEGLKVPAALTYLMAKRQHLDQMRHVVKDMIGNIKKAFHHIIDKQNWLPSQETKNLLKDRVNRINSRIGFPDYLFNDTSIDDTFQSLDVREKESFLLNVIRITQHEMHSDLAKLNETVDPDKEWLMQPLVSNAYFDASSDNISKF
jgi:membrane metallo-endopeptidase-like protein 1